MKTINFIKGIAMPLFILSVSVWVSKVKGQAYLGKSYTPTEKVDMYLEAENIKRPYEVMGKSSVNQGFKSLQKTQDQVIKLGKSKGADGVIVKLVEEVTGSQKNDFGSLNNGNKSSNTFSASSSTMDVKVKKIEAVFIKYKD
ncbi:hypothetical protein [Chryseobacterium sp. JK1]|uniref:hypothetical protein n=1 Tax=Chryseobacterium sp. JK1 TaxID=874294 RepID=UPI003D69C31D